MIDKPGIGPRCRGVRRERGGGPSALVHVRARTPSTSRPLPIRWPVRSMQFVHWPVDPLGYQTLADLFNGFLRPFLRILGSLYPLDPVPAHHQLDPGIRLDPHHHRGSATLGQVQERHHRLTSGQPADLGNPCRQDRSGPRLPVQIPRFRLLKGARL